MSAAGLEAVNGMSCREAAHWYLDHGFLPIPWYVSADGRKITGGSGFAFNEWTVTHADIDQWEDYMQVGLVMSAASGTFAVDVDSYEELARWEQQHGLSDTLRQFTGRDDGGEHRIYRLGPGMTELPRHGKFSREFSHLDVISKGYIAVAPSVHPSGRRYRWDDGAVADVKPAGWQLASYLIDREARVEAGERVNGQAPAGDYDDLDIGALLRTGITSGGHDMTLARVVYQMAWRGVPDEVIAVTWGKIVSITDTDPNRPFTQSDFERHLRGAKEKVAIDGPVVYEPWMGKVARAWQDRREQERRNEEWEQQQLEELNALEDQVMNPLDEMLADVPVGQREAVRKKLQYLLLDKATRGMVDELEFKTQFVEPELKPLGDLLDEPDEEIQFRVDGLWPTGGNVLLAAQYKAGKTTLRDNLVRSLVDGTPFLGEYEVEPVQGRVVVLDLELSKNMMRRWVRDQGIQRTDGAIYTSLRGNASSFNLMDEHAMRYWVRALQDANAEVVILDCLRPILDAIGLSEDKEAGRFLTRFDELLERAGVKESVVIHHMGHDGNRSRGDSRLRDWPDVEWTLLRENDDAHSTRHFSAYGRDVQLDAHVIEYDPETRHMTQGIAVADIPLDNDNNNEDAPRRPGRRAQMTGDQLTDAVMRAIEQSPGILITDLRAAVIGRNTRINEAVARLTEAGTVVSLPRADGNGQGLYIHELDDDHGGS